MDTTSPIRLTQFSPGAGCGCKMAPSVLEEILSSNTLAPKDARLLVGYETKDDAAVYDLGNGQGLISTTDFFTPIVDDPFLFGQIAATNAISDVYAMGGTPILALGLLGWPLSKLPSQVAKSVLEGAKEVCARASVSLAGGHSIESADPLFGLAVNGLVPLTQLKRNMGANVGDLLVLTKPLGVGLITTAEKKNLVLEKDLKEAIKWMTTLNSVGPRVAALSGISALTDVTGFGLLGHLLEMCEGSGVSAQLFWDKIPKIDNVFYYIEKGCSPGGAKRNWKSFGHKIQELSEEQKALLCDPQTSGGLLIAVAPDQVETLCDLLRSENLAHTIIGEMISTNSSHTISLLV